MRQRVGICGILLLLLAAGPVAGDATGPREVVRHFMNALVARDLPSALRMVGVDLPPSAVPVVDKMIDEQPYVKWGVRSYEIQHVERDGGLAMVTVSERHYKDLAPELRARLETAAPFMKRVRWGDNQVTERFVLVHLDGRWQFDTGHSGLKVQDLSFEQLMRSMTRGTVPDEATANHLVAFVNGAGFGQLVQTVGASGFTVPLIAAIAIPSFARARGQARLTACAANLKNLGLALEIYNVDHAIYPSRLSQLEPAYLQAIPTCPEAGADTYSAGYQVAVGAYTVVCQGAHHSALGVPPDHPQYTSREGLIVR